MPSRKVFVLLILLLCVFASQLVQAKGVLTERTYKRLTVIHQLIGDSKYNEALKRLNDLENLVKRRPYEYATVMQTYGFVYAATERYKKAIEAFEIAMQTGQLPEGVQLRMIYNTAQLYATISDYKKAAETYEMWRAKTESPAASAYEFAATIYAQLKESKENQKSVAINGLIYTKDKSDNERGESFVKQISVGKDRILIGVVTLQDNGIYKFKKH